MNIFMSEVKKLYIDNTEVIRAYLSGDLIFGQPPADNDNKSLRLHYDFSTKTNDDENREIIEDLSGNGYHGILQNFTFEGGSGYKDGGLKFDGSDDYVSLESEGLQECTISITAVFPYYPSIKGVIATENGHNLRGRYITLTNNRRLNVKTASVESSDFRLSISASRDTKINIIISVNDFTGRLQIYENGVNVVDTTGSSNDNPTPFKMLGLGYMGSISDIGTLAARHFPGTFYSLRQYDKQFTPEEAAALAAEEMEKYGIEQ